MSDETTEAPALSFSEALGLIEPAVRQAKVIANLEPMIVAGASLQQALSEVEARIRDRKETLGDMANAIATRQTEHDVLLERIAGEKVQAQRDRDVALAEVSAAQSERDARRAEVAQLEKQLADLKAAAAKLSA